jgi:hypothetical protein
VRHVHVDAALFAGEEEQSELAVADDCWSHAPTVPTAAGRQARAVDDKQSRRAGLVACRWRSA